MAERDLIGEVENGLKDAKSTLEYLQARMASGEVVDEKELVALARTVAKYIEEVRSRLQDAVESEIGPVSQDVVREAMRKRLTSEEYVSWLAGEEDRMALRDEVRQERLLRGQVEWKDNADG